MNYLTTQVSGIDALLSKHFQRFMATRGSFGSYRRKLLNYSPRWEWYSSIMLLKKLPTEPLPQVDFADDSDGSAKKLVLSLLNVNVSLDDLLNYLLHMFGHTGYEKKPIVEIDFPLAAALLLQRDLFGDAYGEVMGKGLRSGTGYFPTPQSLCNMIVEMTMKDCELTHTVNDPCVGSGRMLLSASNKSLFLSGNDVNPVCVKMTLVNAYMFAPWIAIPVTDLKPNLQRNLYAEDTFSF